MAGLRRGIITERKGVSDVLSIAFMFLIVVFAGVLLHSYRLGAIDSAVSRQMQLKAEYLYRALELSQVENYSLSYLAAVAENVIGVSPQVVPGDYLRSRLDVLLSYLRPSGYGVVFEVRHENSVWVQISPSDSGPPSPNVEKFSFSGKYTIVVAGLAENRVAQAEATITLFRKG
ncbi:MAG: hypothetical protein ACP5PX_01165 [Candidatus Hadarchaeum sp.]|uniref:hypothetical protein n=1 Tax=Candidatus Hadarchaeum sp. TaxID=2883567 RepID=UPI003D0C40D7